MQTYDKYKDCGIKWIENVPEHWELIPNKFVFHLKKKLVGKHSSEYDLLSLTLRGIIKRNMENPEGKFPAEFDTYQEVKINDFVFCLFDVEETPRTVGLSNFNGMITGAYTVMGLMGENFAKYLYYYYLNADDKKQLKFLYRGLRNTIPKDSFFSLKTAIPPIKEQEAIANFLDDKIAKIDELVQTKEQQIEKLKELRQAKIHQAVTKGLQNNLALNEVEMKDSGVEWIGEIPKHWEVKRLKHLMRINNGLDYKHVQVNEGYPVIGSGGQFSYASKYLYDGEVLFLGRKGTIDKPLYFKGKFWTVDTMFYCVINEKGITKYLYYISTTIPFKYYSTATALPSMTQSDLNNHQISIPPIQEQEKIVAYLDEVTTKIAQAISQKEEQITKLKEYKQSLISDVVTGKIKVSSI